MADDFRGVRHMAFIEINHVNVHYECWNEFGSETVVFLHGFTGSTKTWHEQVSLLPATYRIIAVDLVGHGKTDSPNDVAHYTMENQVELLHELLKVLKVLPFHLVGYSMGGRVALSYAVRYPVDVVSLILESATPGIIDEQQRIERQKSDHALACKIEKEGVEAFIDYWESIPLFASQKQLPVERQAKLRSERQNQQAIGLANSLRMMGTGIMPEVWEDVATLPMQTTLITGELDSKFVNIANEMQQKNKKMVHITVPSVGHAIHVENPQKFATIVKEAISN